MQLVGPYALLRRPPRPPARGSTPTAPLAPYAPSPVTGLVVGVASPTLVWSAPGATSYDVAFGTTSTPPTVATGQTASTYAPGVLLDGTRYYWSIVAHNSVGATAGPLWSFTAELDPDVITNATTSLPHP